METKERSTTNTPAAGVIWSFGSFLFDEQRLELTVAGEVADVEPRPLELLRHLLRRAGELVTKDELLETVWPNRVASESLLTKTVAKLRQALRDEDQLLIRTVYGQGYRLIAPVTVKAASSETVGASKLAPALATGDRSPSRPNWILQKVLSSGRNELWLARHDKTGQFRVFKFARDAEGLRALKREVTLYRVLHQTANIRDRLLGVLDWNLDEPPCFIEYPYIADGSLDQWLKRQDSTGLSCSLAQKLELIAQAADALAAAHDAGVLHKDVKPSNMLIDIDSAGRPSIRLSDFGNGDLDLERLALLEITRLGFTQALDQRDGNTSGTPLYLAPELLTGQACSARSDIYALGVVLYQLVIGDFRRPLAPGWEREIADPLLCADIAACADFDPLHRLADARVLAHRLRDLETRRAALVTPQTGFVPGRGEIASPARRRWLLAGGALAGISLLSAGLLWNHRHSSIGATPRIAVLPFNDKSVGGIEPVLANGVASDVIVRLQRLAQLRVVARESAFKLKAVSSEPSELARLKAQLNADYALVGDVYRNRDRVRITAHLVTVSNGQIVWQDTFDQAATNVGALAGMIANAALHALGITSTPGPEASSEAYELYLAGEYAFEARTADAIRKARDYYQRAIDLDPAYARAYAGLAKTWLAEADYGFGLNWREAAARTQPLLDKAFLLEPDLLEALIVQGVLYINLLQFERALSCLTRAVELFPGSARAHFTLGVCYDYDTAVKPALGHYQHALELDPLNVLVDRRIGMAQMWLGQYRSAQQHFKRTIELMPQTAMGHWGLASLGYARGRYDDAIRAYRQGLGVDSRRANLWNEVAWLYMDLGMPDEARAALDNQLRLDKSPADALRDTARLLLLENKPQAMAEFLAQNNLLTNMEPGISVDSMLLASIGGQAVDVASIDKCLQQMRADPTPWVGSYDIFLGHCTWLRIATLYTLAGQPDRAAPLLTETEALIHRIKANGNIYHTIPYFESCIAMLRGQLELALQHLGAAVDAGWRRGWWIRWDPAYRALRSDARLDALLSRIERDVHLQRNNLIRT